MRLEMCEVMGAIKSTLLPFILFFIGTVSSSEHYYRICQGCDAVIIKQQVMDELNSSHCYGEACVIAKTEQQTPLTYHFFTGLPPMWGSTFVVSDKEGDLLMEESIVLSKSSESFFKSMQLMKSEYINMIKNINLSLSALTGFSEQQATENFSQYKMSKGSRCLINHESSSPFDYFKPEVKANFDLIINTKIDEHSPYFESLKQKVVQTLGGKLTRVFYQLLNQQNRQVKAVFANGGYLAFDVVWSNGFFYFQINFPLSRAGAGVGSKENVNPPLSRFFMKRGGRILPRVGKVIVHDPCLLKDLELALKYVGIEKRLE